MSIYGNLFVTESVETYRESSLMNYNFDMYEYIHQETVNLKNMINSCVDFEQRTVLESQLVFMEEFEIKTFFKNLIVKFKEIVKKILAKIQEIATKFANKKFIDFWKNAKLDNETLAKQMYYAVEKYNKGDYEGFYIDFTFPVKKQLDLNELTEKIHKQFVNDDFESAWTTVKEEYIGYADSSFISCDFSNFEEFKNKNSETIKDISQNKSKIIDVLSGKNIYEAKKLIIKLEADMERTLNKMKDEDSDNSKQKASKIFSIISKFVREITGRMFSDFRFFLSLSSYAVKANPDNPEDNDYDYENEKVEKRNEKSRDEEKKIADNYFGKEKHKEKL